jgi:SAM-dependent methyltransferase
MSTTAATSYDDLPYESRFNPVSHPDRIATMATLHGLKPPPIERCRVLELGSADGENLLAMAQTLPDATFLGLDLSPRQIADGKASALALGFRNVSLRAMNLIDVDDSLGMFEYIICHGVYSWVPPPVRDKILQICARNLVPGGVAYISYNTYPGWHMRAMLREMMLYHTEGTGAPLARVQQARGLLEFVARSATPEEAPYARYMRQEAKAFEKLRDSYIFHEHLEDQNQPVYFHQFAADAISHGLRYLCSSHFNVLDTNLSHEVKEMLRGLGADVIRREQYLDFIMGRTFRHSLLCHGDLMSYDAPWPGAIPSLRLTAMARPESAARDIQGTAPEPFRTQYGDTLMVDEPLLKAALVALFARWPLSFGFEELWAETLDRLDRTEATINVDREVFAFALLQAYLSHLVNLNVWDPPVAVTPGQRPCTTALARRDAAADDRVVNLRGGYAVLQDFDRLVLALLDGTRDRGAVTEALARSIAEGRVTLQREGQPMTGNAEDREMLARSVNESLDRIAGEALLLAD